MTNTINDIIRYLEQIAPPVYQESYDNAGLIVGDAQTLCSGVVTCLDATEDVIEEAIKLQCNLVVAHHPIVFKGLKRFNGRHYVERVVMKAIKNDIAIYAIHTNLDNMYWQGVNAKIAEKLKLEKTRILAPKANLKQILVNINPEQIDNFRQAMAEHGAIHEEQSFASLGVQTMVNQVYSGMQLVFNFAKAHQDLINQVLADYRDYITGHTIYSIDNRNAQIGSGMIGQLKKPMQTEQFLKFLKKTMQTGCIKYTAVLKENIEKVALCGGAGGFLLKAAISQQADVFITADYKYHEFFDADGRIMIADIGHYESEQFTIELLHDLISQKFTNFATHLTKVNTNPVNYL